MSYRILAIAMLLATLASSWMLGGWFGYRQVEQESLQESFRYRQLVANELNRYSPIPELMAEHPLLAEALRSPENPELLLKANEQMQRMATIVGSSDVYLMDDSGTTIAANNYQRPDSFVGRNFDFRPYFQDAMDTGEGALYFALGTTSGVRGLYFSHPVRGEDGTIVGVIAMKVLVHSLEAQWRRPGAPGKAEMVVLDDAGISFLSSRSEWLYRDFSGEAPNGKASPAPRRYPGRDLAPIESNNLGRPWGLSDQADLLFVGGQDTGGEYVRVTTPLPSLDWRLEVMVSTRSVVWTRLGFVAAGTAFFVVGLLATLYLRERYRREAELALRGEQLERSVANRTAELRETQHELIQAAKLAVLGQMSAGLNHEINQPLTAIQTYARNSRRFLEKGASEMVDANLAEIISLCDKMAELTRQFKVFARKSEGPPAQVDLRQAVDGAIKIMAAQEGRSDLQIHWRRSESPVQCHGDLIRIEQVMVNLIANAIQAVENCDHPQIDIDVEEGDQHCYCYVRDNGPGLPESTEQIFEPFFTTKSVKQGLGLGLSISRQIVHALGGSLTGRNRADGPGAEFVLTLTRRGATE